MGLPSNDTPLILNFDSEILMDLGVRVYRVKSMFDERGTWAMLLRWTMVRSCASTATTNFFQSEIKKNHAGQVM